MAIKITSHDSLLNYEEAAARLRVHPITLTRWANARKIDHVKMGKRVFFTERQIEEFLNRSLVKAEEADR